MKSWTRNFEKPKRTSIVKYLISTTIHRTSPNLSVEMRRLKTSASSWAAWWKNFRSWREKLKKESLKNWAPAILARSVWIIWKNRLRQWPTRMYLKGCWTSGDAKGWTEWWWSIFWETGTTMLPSHWLRDQVWRIWQISVRFFLFLAGRG